MATQASSRRIRLGILALPVGAVLILAGTVIYGRGPESLDNLRAYAEIASSSRTAVSNFLTSVGQLLVIFGFVALYACMASGRAERWAFFAMVLCVSGIVSSFAYWAGTSGLEAVAAEQYLKGQRAVLEEWVDLFDWSSVFLLILNPGLFSIGLILFGVAIWRSRTLPQGAAILWLAVLLFQLATPLTWWATVVSFLLLTIASGWIAWAVWQWPSDKVAETDTQARVLQGGTSLQPRTAASRIRLGILALPASAALLLAANVVYGPEPGSPGDVRAYAEFTVSTRYAVFAFLASISALLSIFGFVALYACMASDRAERWAFFAMVLCVPGSVGGFAVSAGASGASAVAAEQYLQGQRAVWEKWFDLFDWSSVLLLVLNVVLFSVGLVLFGIAIWRTETLPQGAAVLWFANVALFLAAPLTWLAVPISFLLLTVAGGWIAWSVWRRPPEKVAGPEARPRVR